MNRYHKISIVSLSVICAVLAIALLSLFFTNKFKRASKPLTQKRVIKLPSNPYQDIIINNKVAKRGRGPSCESRYKAIASVLSQFRRPITVLDIGAAEGYMSLRIAHDFDATCVMVEHQSGESGGFLKDLCELNTDRDNIILLYKRITAEELKFLSESEHFDVVIALNVLHHFPAEKWQMAANAVLDLADYAIIETPAAEDKYSCGRVNLPGIINFLEKNNGKIIAKTARVHTSPDTFAKTYLVKGRGKSLKRRGLLDLNNSGYEIKSDINDRYLVRKSDNQKLDWPQGISFMTFKLFNGVYPKKFMIKESLAKLKESSLSIVPQDIVIQGKKLVSLSQTNNKDLRTYDDDMLDYVCGIVDTSNMKKVVSFCKEIQNKLVANN